MGGLGPGPPGRPLNPGLPSQWTWIRVEATNAVASNSSSRTRQETARPRKGADERGRPGADRGWRRASAS